MDLPLYMICLNAFVAVLILLTMLGLLMSAITHLFPAQKPVARAPMMAAISMVVSQLYPGARVTRIEEINPLEKR